MLKVEMLTDNGKISEGDINEIAIVLDNAGIDLLCEELQRLKSVPSPDHIHLGTEEWAGKAWISSLLSRGIFGSIS